MSRQIEPRLGATSSPSVAASCWWFLSCVGMTIGAITGVAALNFFLLCAFKTKQNIAVRGALTEARQGKKIAIIDELVWEDSLLPVAAVKQLDGVPEVATIGSSRANIHRTMLSLPSGASYYCHTLPRAGLEEVLGIIGCYLRYHQAVPKTMIICVDPWFFNDDYDGGWSSLTWHALAAERTLGASSFAMRFTRAAQRAASYYQRLLTFDFLIASFRRLKGTYRGYQITETLSEENHQILLADGSYIPKDSFRRTPPARIRDFILHDTRPRERFARLSNCARFEQLLVWLREQGSAVILLRMPYHPLAYQMLTAPGQGYGLPLVQDYLDQLSARLQVPLLGSFNPAAVGAQEEDFYDDVHHGDDITARAIGSLALFAQNLK